MNRRLLPLAVLPVSVLVSQIVTAQTPPPQGDFLERLKRTEAWEREIEEKQPPDKVLDAAGVKPGMVVGEIGAGRGRYTLHLARRVGASGKVYANDIDADALAFLRQRCQKDGIGNVEIVQGEIEDARLPKGSLDAIFMVWVYHMVEKPVPLLRSFAASLKPGARVVMVEPIPQDIEGEVKTAAAHGHGNVHVNLLTPASVEAYAREAGFRLVSTMDKLLERDIIYVLAKE
jgi:ubiquinone/menaquinone biosynthesis C-methylase UbiE